MKRFRKLLAAVSLTLSMAAGMTAAAGAASTGITASVETEVTVKTKATQKTSSYTGWKKTGGKTYYYKKGTKVTNKWVTIDGSRYYFDKKGVLQTSKWIGNYYVDSTGAWVKNAVKSGRWSGMYYYNASGAMLKSGVYVIGGKAYLFGPEGLCYNKMGYKNRMMIITKSTSPKVNVGYYIKKDGTSARSEWVYLGSCMAQDSYWQGYFRSFGWGYFNENGELDVSKVKDSGWKTVQIIDPTVKTVSPKSGVTVNKQGYYTLKPKKGKKAYYQWVIRNASTNLEDARTVHAVTKTTYNIAAGMGLANNPWCLRYINCTLERQENGLNKKYPEVKG